LPDLYGLILRAAQAMRTARQAENEVAWLMARMRRNAKAIAAARLAEDGVVSFPTLSPSGVVSRQAPSPIASED
jgi:2-methylcitrate dehydratase PrpD